MRKERDHWYVRLERNPTVARRRAASKISCLNTRYRIGGPDAPIVFTEGGTTFDALNLDFPTDPQHKDLNSGERG